MAKFYFYYSAMNAGKSTTLLQSNYNYHERGMETILFAPKCNNHCGEPIIYSRIGLRQKATLFDSNFHFWHHIQEELKKMENLCCILVDEAHFLTKTQVAQLVMITKKSHIPVLCYGLRSDFMAEPFPGSIYLLAWADKLVELKTICYCGKKATMNVRMDDKQQPTKKGSQICIGGNERYLSVCMHHFNTMIGSVEDIAFERAEV